MLLRMTSKFLNAIMVLLACLLFGTRGGFCDGTPETATGSLWSRVDEKLRELVEEGRLPGLSIAVMKGGDTVFARGYGWADIEQKIPVTSATIFPIASIEKQFIAAKILQLSEANMLSLNDPITQVLTELYTGGETIRIKDMLHQVSGLQDEEMIEERLSGDSVNSENAKPGFATDAAAIPVGEGFDPGHQVGLYKNEPLLFRPGDKWAYCNSNYDLLCLMVAKLTHTTYYNAISELVTSAGVKTYYPKWTPAPSEDSFHVAHGYYLSGGGFSPVREENTGCGWTNPSGLAQWAYALSSGRLVSEDSYSQMISPASLNDGREWPYGFGVALSVFAGRTKYSHTGHATGFTSVVSHYHAEDLSIALMTNLGHAFVVPVIEQQVARMIFGEPEPVFTNLPVDSSLLQRSTGTFDGGPWWFVISESDGRMEMDIRAPGTARESQSYFSTPLLYQGSGYFVGAIEPDAIWIKVDTSASKINEVRASIFGSGIQIQAFRTE